MKSVEKLTEDTKFEVIGAGPRGKLSRRQRIMLAGNARYKKNKRKAIMETTVYEDGRIYKEWVHPTKGKRKERKWT